MDSSPLAALGIGMSSVIRCDTCGGRISVDGIRPETMEQGEYQVSCFSCIHCGRKYQITTTDNSQRKGIERRRRMGLRIRAAFGRRLRRETVNQWRREYDRLGRALDRRASWLREVGDEILSGKEIPRKDGTENGAGKLGDCGGQTDGQGGTEGLQAD